MHNIKVKLFLSILLFGTIAFCGDLTLMPDDFLNELAEDLELRGIIPAQPGYRPYSTTELLKAVSENPAVFYTPRTRRILNRIVVPDRAWFMWTPGVWYGSDWEKDKTTGYGRMKIGIGGIHKDFSLVGIYRLDSGWYYDPEYFGGRWERVSGKSDQVYLRWRKGDYSVQLGRDYLSYALGMCLSGKKPIEKIQVTFRFGKYFRTHWFIGQLDEYVDYADEEKIIYERYLAGHRIEISSGPFLFAFNELMLFGGVGRKIEFYYLLPLYTLHGEQLNHRWDDNTLWSVDLRFLMPPLSLWGEIMVDDFQIDRETTADREPMEFGFAFQTDYGLTFKNLFLTPNLRFELVTNRTYNQQHSWNRFLYENKSLGSEVGNDFHKFSVGTKIFSKNFGGKVNFFHLEKGEGRIDDEWITPWIEDPSWTESFPSGTIEIKNGTEISFFWDKNIYSHKNFSFDIDLRFDTKISSVRNAGHHKDKTRTEWEFKIDIGIESMILGL